MEAAKTDGNGQLIRFSFTEASVGAIEPPQRGKRVTYYDGAQPGLQMRVSSGAKVFYVFARPHGGRPERVKIGRWPNITVKTARAEAKKIVAKLAAAESPAAARRAVKGELKLGELAERYFADREKAGKRSVADLRAMWELWLGQLPDTPPKPHGRERKKPAEAVDWSLRRLSEITAPQVSALHSRIERSGKPYAANRVHELLRAMYRFAIKNELATTNPAANITQAEETPRRRYLGKNELPAFAAALKQEQQPWRDYFTVLLYIGYRKSAVCAMRWQDIDLEAGAWAVPGENAKNGEPIVLPLSGPALETLRRRSRDRESADWVFPGGGGAGHVTQPKKAWKRLLQRAGLKDLRIHDLRHTLGSWLATSGASLLEIGRVLGHKDQRSTQVYAHLQAEAARRSVATAHKAMRAALSNPKVVPLPLGKARA